VQHQLRWLFDHKYGYGQIHNHPYDGQECDEYKTYELGNYDEKLWDDENIHTYQNFYGSSTTFQNKKFHFQENGSKKAAGGFAPCDPQTSQV